MHMRYRKFNLIVSCLIALLVLGWQFANGQGERNLPKLTEEERRVMDVRMFNELMVRKRAWIGKTREMRYELIKGMGDKGFEPAHLALRLFEVEPGTWSRGFDADAFDRLRELADAGDPTSQCLAAMVIWRWKLKELEPLRKEYIMKAARAGQARCTSQLGTIYRDEMKSKEGMERWRELLLEAAKLGDQQSQVVLAIGYARGAWGFPFNIGKTKCWLEVAKRAGTGKSTNFKARLAGWVLTASKRGLNIDSRDYDPEQFCGKPAAVNKK